MRTTLALDDGLLAEAQRLTGTMEKTALVREALTALIERESARRLARLGGTDPALEDIPRRQTEPLPGRAAATTEATVTTVTTGSQ